MAWSFGLLLSGAMTLTQQVGPAGNEAPRAQPFMNPISESAIPIRPAGFRPRLDALDLLRGAVMIIMALDHVRDFVGGDAIHFDPTDLTKTNAALFLTRWITHFCAPVFCFLAGTGAFLSLGRGRTKSDVSWFLFTRGLWLVLLEVTVINLGWTFHLPWHGFFVQVIWALGWSMVCLAGLIHLPLWAVAGFGICMIAGHNLLDSVNPDALGGWSGFWKVLHVSGMVRVTPTFGIFVIYPLIPWIGVMASGFSFGSLLRKERPARRRVVLWLGVGLTAAFVALRAINLYGDPRPWPPQPTLLFTVFSFVKCEKYPPSLLYLLMTLGPALIALAFFDRELWAWSKPIVTFGRVPLFYYLLHIPLIHGLAVGLAYLQSAGSAAASGFGLLGVYGVWALVILLLYPLCFWFAALKQRRRDAWLSYF